ncbi:hypothetical protein [Mesorhizobium japonicum]|uniref:hypothetical protein n=1 Tax=Mesorhizobium japonicum TaxID=2066070 RepID=UPI0012FE99AE|nr:hypothetical protein [Mesorhizobium japonicum]
MKFPDKLEFLAAFGLEPEDEDPSTSYVRYVFRSNTGPLEAEVSFSDVSKSFQISTRIAGNIFGTISSEKVNLIEITQGQNGESGLRVVFNIHDVVSEALITFTPEITYHWWLIGE